MHWISRPSRRGLPSSASVGNAAHDPWQGGGGRAWGGSMSIATDPRAITLLRGGPKWDGTQWRFKRRIAVLMKVSKSTDSTFSISLPPAATIRQTF